MNSTDYNWLNVSEYFNYSTGLKHQVPLSRTIILGGILGCINIITICGNLLVLLAVYVNSHLRSTTNYFIVNLAVADLFLGVTVLPFSATLETLQYWPFGQIFCDIWASADVLWCTASIMTLCVISLDRYIGVTRPLQHSTIISERKSFYIIVLVWVLSVAISVAPLIGWKEPTMPIEGECSVTKQVGYVVFSAAGSFYIPMFIIIVVYAKIYRAATAHSKYLSSGMKTTRIGQESDVVLRIHTGNKTNTPSRPNILQQYQSSSSSEHSEGSTRKISSKVTLAGRMAKFKKEKKAAKTLGIVVGVFIVCWFPFFFYLPLSVLCSRCHGPDELFNVIFWLGYCNSMMNPIIYACSSREFKRAFIRVLRCQFRRRPRLFMNYSPGSVNELRQFSTTTYFSSSDRHTVSKRSLQPKSHSSEMRLSRKMSSNQPFMSLHVFADKRKPSPHSSNGGDNSFHSSYSDLADDEFSEIISCYNSNYIGQNIMIRSTSIPSHRGTFAKDEGYIQAFTSNNSSRHHTVL